jgi:hypothetical protein
VLASQMEQYELLVHSDKARLFELEAYEHLWSQTIPQNSSLSFSPVRYPHATQGIFISLLSHIYQRYRHGHIYATPTPITAAGA